MRYSGRGSGIYSIYLDKNGGPVSCRPSKTNRTWNMIDPTPGRGRIWRPSKKAKARINAAKRN